MDGPEKRPHVVTGNTPKPSEKRARDEIHNDHAEERPARRTLAFQGKGSPMQKVCSPYTTLLLHSPLVRRKIDHEEIKHVIISVYFKKASRRILQKAKLVRSPKSPKQLLSPKKRKTVAISWGKSEEIALVQFIALFSELKTGEWPIFGDQHEYWGKAAEFIQETVGTSHKRTSKIFFFKSIAYSFKHVFIFCEL